ncbi:MAG: response regulator [Chitinophagaceae bacterium]|nr:response regulator [Chitinophagaceae bacterium]
MHDLWLYNPDTNKWTDTLPGTVFTTNKKPRLYNCWLQDSRGTIWLGTSNGLFCWKGAPYNLQTAEEAFGIKHAAAKQVIQCLLEDSRGNVWIGTDSVMAILQPSVGKLQAIVEVPGVTGLHFYSLQQDKNGDIWAGTQAGLLRFDPVQKHTTIYNTYDGLPDNEFNLRAVATDSKGDLYFGTYNGLLHFSTNDISRFQVNAPLAITGIRVFDKPLPASQLPLPANGQVTLRHYEDVVTIEFSLLNFIKPYKTRYAWMLKGVDKSWQYGNTPQVTYSQLSPGNYVFLVKAANHDGYWIEEPVALTIKVLPPLWRAWWAMLAYILLALAGMVFIIRFFWLRARFRRREAMQQFKLDFFTNISHEIRTHLTLIAAPVEQIMLERSQDAPLLHRLRPIKNNAEKLQNLVSEMMDLNQTETGNLRLKIEKHNLAAFLQETINAVQVSADTRQITLLLDCANLHLYLYFDAIQMEKVFFNLLTNAIKFTQAGGTIKVTAAELENKVAIMVEDNGKGMDKITLQKLFTAYYQGEQQQGAQAGYGLGLALAKSITELHHGHIVVTSEEAKPGTSGHTCFTVTLLKGYEHYPEAVLQPAADIPALPEEEIASGAGGDEVLPLLLLAEDNEELMQFLTQSLSARYRVLQCTNGSQALYTAQQQLPDLVISDVMMPGMDGIALCKALKNNEYTNHIPVVLLTAKVQASHQMEGLSAGADAYITKPFSVQMLELQLSNLTAARVAMQQRLALQVARQPKQENGKTGIQEAFLNQVQQLIEAHLDDPEFGVPALSTLLTMSQTVLYKKIKALTGLSVQDFIRNTRLKKAAQLLLETDMHVNEVAFAVGYSDRKYFSREFKKQYGKSPSEFTGSET